MESHNKLAFLQNVKTNEFPFLKSKMHLRSSKRKRGIVREREGRGREWKNTFQTQIILYTKWINLKTLFNLINLNIF